MAAALAAKEKMSFDAQQRRFEAEQREVWFPLLCLASTGKVWERVLARRREEQQLHDLYSMRFEKSARAIQRVWRLFVSRRRWRFQIVKERFLRKFIFRHRMRSYLHWRKIGPGIILEWSHEMRQRQLERDKPDVKPLTVGLTALVFLRGAKTVRKFLHSQVWKWKGRKILLRKQLVTCERRSIKSSKAGHNAAIRTMEKMARSPRSSKTKLDKKKGPRPNDMSVEEKAAMQLLEEGLPEPLSGVCLDEIAERMYGYYNLGQKAHVRQWIQDVAAFDEVQRDRTPTPLHCNALLTPTPTERMRPPLWPNHTRPGGFHLQPECHIPVS